MVKLFVLFLIITNLQSAEIAQFAKKRNYATNYVQALQQAKLQKRPLMLVMVTHYCPWCRKMERRTLKNKKINSIVHKNFVPLILNRETDSFPKQFDTPRIPTVFFIDPEDETLFWETIGFVKRKDFKDALLEAIKLYEKRKK